MIKAKSKFSSTIQLRNILINDSKLYNYVENKIYPINAPEGVEGSFIIYYRDEYSKNYIQQGVYQDVCKVFLNIITTEYDEGIEIVEIVNEILEGVHVDDDGYYFTVRIIDSTEVFEDNKYIQILLLEVE